MRKMILTLAAILASSTASAQSINLPSQAVVDEPVSLTIDGLQPGSEIELEVERVLVSGAAAMSRTRFVADDRRMVDPARQVPVAGYRGTDAAGPFWSMAPQTGVRPETDRNHLTVRARIGDAVIATASTPLREMAPGVSFEEVAAFPGARLYRPADTRRRPVIILLGGSEGGASFGRSMGPRLAARGYAVLALPYYNAWWGTPAIPGLPNAFVDIPVDRLESARRWIGRRADLDAGVIGLYGVSKGGEFAMIAATRFAWLRAVIGIVPSDVVWEGWGAQGSATPGSSFAWRGRPLPFTPYQGIAEAIAALSRGERAPLVVPHLAGRRANPDRAAAARILVEAYRGAMLIAGGDRDQTWPSGEMARAIAERRAAAGRTTVALSFADAGHGLAATGWAPLAYRGFEAEAPANAKAQREVWDATLRFLEVHLPMR